MDSLVSIPVTEIDDAVAQATDGVIGAELQLTTTGSASH
jgi:hypothetical protein